MCKIKVCSFSKLIGMKCVILCTSPSCEFYLVGVRSFTKSLRLELKKQPSYEGIILVQKSAFNNECSNHWTLSVTIRGSKLVRCVKIRIAYARGIKSCLQAISCFSQVSVLVSLNRAGIALISSTHLFILCFGLTFVSSISLSVKRINPSGKANIDMILALIS